MNRESALYWTSLPVCALSMVFMFGCSQEALQDQQDEVEVQELNLEQSEKVVPLDDAF